MVLHHVNFPTLMSPPHPLNFGKRNRHATDKHTGVPSRPSHSKMIYSLKGTDTPCIIACACSCRPSVISKGWSTVPAHLGKLVKDCGEAVVPVLLRKFDLQAHNRGCGSSHSLQG